MKKFISIALILLTVIAKAQLVTYSPMNADFETTIAGHLPGDAASQTRLGKLKTTLRSFTSL